MKQIISCFLSKELFFSCRKIKELRKETPQMHKLNFKSIVFQASFYNSNKELLMTQRSSLKCDNPSSVLIPSTTRYNKLYQVKPSYTEQVIEQYSEQEFYSGWCTKVRPNDTLVKHHNDITYGAKRIKTLGPKIWN